jgi:hypothetical protein
MLALLVGARHVNLPNVTPIFIVQKPELAMHGPPQPLTPTPTTKDNTQNEFNLHRIVF